VAKRAAKVRENGRISRGFIEAARVKVVINCETKVKVMDKVNCELYRFTNELKLRAQFAHQCKRMDNDHPCSMDRHRTWSGRVQGPVAAVHLLHRQA
jgi:hypothetical protein